MLHMTEKDRIFLELLRKEINELKERMDTLRALQRELESSNQPSTTSRHGPREGSETSRAIGAIQQIFSQSDKTAMSPAEVYEESQRRAYGLSSQLIRQILSRNPELFPRVKRGLYTTNLRQEQGSEETGHGRQIPWDDIPAPPDDDDDSGALFEDEIKEPPIAKAG